MPMLVGFHAEGHDHLILRAFLAKLLGLPEEEIEPDWVEGAGRGWSFVLDILPKALRRFYAKCAQLAVVALDNDGNLDLAAGGLQEDPQRPRHWNHLAAETENCRWCRLQSLIENIRPSLNWVIGKPGQTWPIIIAVAVEMIESWLLAATAIVSPGMGAIQAEQMARQRLKPLLYGKPEATRMDVESVALPIVRALDPEHLATLSVRSRSFGMFADEVARHRPTILGSRDCWPSPSTLPSPAAYADRQ